MSFKENLEKHENKEEDEDVKEEEPENTSEYIGCPFDGENPLALISCGSSIYLGGVMNVEDYLVDLSFPVRYIEQIMQTKEGKAKLTTSMMKVYPSLDTLISMMVKPDTIYMLRSYVQQDRLLASAYEQQVMRYRSDDIGLASSSKIIA